jgi:hypothetical protein
MKRIFLFLLTLIISVTYLPNSQHVLAVDFVQECPVDGNEVRCLKGKLFNKCPKQDGVRYTLFGGNLLHCDDGNCCVRKDIQTCPSPSFCSSSSDLDGRGYKYAGVLCVDGNGNPGKCWVINASGFADQCAPYPNECDSDCGAGKMCKYVYDELQCPNLLHACWTCKKDTNGTCTPTQENTCVTEETKDYRKCVDTQYLACGPLDGDWMSWPYSSCGSDLKTCCHNRSVKPCGPPGKCFTKSCPKGFTYISECGKNSSGESLKCCKAAVQDDVKPPRDAAYRGPVIDSLEKILGPIVKILYYGGLSIGVLFIIISGYKLMVSQGNPQQTQDAQEQLTAAILGIIFILLSVTILRIILTRVVGVGLSI